MPLTLDEMKANRRKWVEALRSGEYVQARHQLTCGGGYCCLGVLAVIAGVEGERIAGELALREMPEAMQFVGLRELSGAFGDDSLASRNDKGASFSEIADLIESEPRGLFISPPTPEGN